MIEAASIATDVEVSAIWKPNPTVRGTFTILYTCITTLIICVWSALHMDIFLRSSRWKSFLHKLGWMTLGLLAPEFLLFLAFKQKRMAKYLLQECGIMHFPLQVHDTPWYKKLLRRTPADTQPAVQPDEERGATAGVQPDTQPDEEVGAKAGAQPDVGPDQPRDTAPIKRQHPWTLAHGFYACMGGYVFDLSSDDPNMPGVPSPEERFTITPHGVRFLMKHTPSLIPDISAGSIADRSNASGLAKTILFLQVLWFCASCASRYQQQLPLSLLEITTLAHGLCTLATYYMWWDKPLDISEPTVITGAKARDICALMMMCSQRRKYILGVLRFGDEDVEMDHVKWHLSIIDDNGKRSQLTYKQRVVDGSRQPWYVRRSSTTAAEPGADDFRRWAHASNAVDQYLGGRRPDDEWHKHTLVEQNSSLGASIHSEISQRRDRFVVAAAAICLPAVYALPHFLGWNSHFPSGVEHIIWRAAIATMIVYGIVISIVTFTCHKMPFRLYLALQAVAKVLYISSSMYILVESFRQLLYLPQQAYELPSLSIYWPHFS